MTLGTQSASLVPAITSPTTINHIPGEPFSYQITAANGPVIQYEIDPANEIASNGLALSGTGLLSGTIDQGDDWANPANYTQGKYTVTLLVRMRNAAGWSANIITLNLYQTQIYYVRAGAAGNGSGTDWTNAYPTFPARMERGAIYYVADGNYGGIAFSTPAQGTTPITIRKATIASHGTETGWQNSYGDGQAEFLTIHFNTAYWLLDGVTGGGPGSWTTGFGIRIHHTGVQQGIKTAAGATHITVEHVELEGNGGDGAGAGDNDCFWLGAHNFTARQFYARNAGRCIVFSNQDVRNALFEYGYTGRHESHPNQHSQVASMWGYGAKAKDWTFRFCRITHIEGTGGLIYDGTGLTVHGCIFAATAGTSIGGGNGVIGSWTSYACLNARIFNNTFVNCGSPAVGIYNGVYSGEFRNNLVFNSNAGSAFGVGGFPAAAPLGNAITTSHNYYIDAGGTPTEASAQTGTGSPFVNLAGENFALSSNSTAGTNLGAGFNTDMLGNPRTTWTRGALEYTA